MSGLDPAASRRIEMRGKTVFAEPQRIGVSGEQMTVFDSAIVMRGHDANAGAARRAARVAAIFG